MPKSFEDWIIEQHSKKTGVPTRYYPTGHDARQRMEEAIAHPSGPRALLNARNREVSGVGPNERFVPKETPNMDMFPDPGPSAPNRLTPQSVRNIRDMLTAQMLSQVPGNAVAALKELRQIEMEKQNRNISNEETMYRLQRIDDDLLFEGEFVGDPQSEDDLLTEPRFSSNRKAALI